MFTAFQRTLLPLTSKSPMLLHPVAGLKPNPFFFTQMRSFGASTVNIEGSNAPYAGPIAIKVKMVKQKTTDDILTASLDKAKSVMTPVCFYPIAQGTVHC